MTRRPLRHTLAAVAVLAFAAACGSGDTTTPTATTTTASDAPIWNPCTELSDTSLQSAGLNPATKKVDVGGVHFEGWQTCRWQPNGYKVLTPTSYFVRVLSANGKTFADIRRRDDLNHDFTDVTIDGRPALQYRVGSSRDAIYTCDITLATAQGIVTVAIDGDEDSPPACPLAQRITKTLLFALPK